LCVCILLTFVKRSLILDGTDITDIRRNRHHYSHTITIPTPPLVSSTLHGQKRCSLSSPPYFLQTTHIHPPLPQFLTHLCTSPTDTPYIPSPHPHPKPLIRLPIILQAVLARPRLRVCTFLFVVGKCGPPQPLAWLVPIFCSCHHEDFIEAHSFMDSMPLLTPNLSFRTQVVPRLTLLPRFLRNLVEN